MNRERALAILYEMAIVIGGEIRLDPLLTRTLQRLLFHTSFPCGMIFLDEGEPLSSPAGDEDMEIRLGMSLGDFELARHNKARVRVPAALLRGQAELAEDRALLNRLPCRKDYYNAYLRLPVGDAGVILLLAPRMPVTDLPLTMIFQPVLNNLVKSIQLCRSNEAYTQGILTDKRLAEVALQHLSYRNRLILDSVDDGICGVDRNGYATFVNPAAARMLGFRPEELVGRSLHEIVHKAPEVHCPVMKTIRDGGVRRSSEDLFMRRDGTIFPVELTSTPLRESGMSRGAVIVFRDITERRERERDIRQLAAIVASSDDAIIGKTLDGTVLSWNRGAEAIYGYTAEEMKGRSVQILCPPDFESDVPNILEKIRRGEHIDHYETVRVRKDGRRIFVSLTVSPVKEGDTVVGASTIARDITELKQMEDSLLEQKLLAEGIVANSAVPTFVLGPGHKVLFWNRACEELTGVAAADVTGTTDHWKPFYDHERPTLADIVIEGTFDRLDELYQSWQRSGPGRDGIQSEGWYRNLNGKDRYMYFEAVPIFGKKRELVVAIETLHDITERKKAETDLRRLNRALRTLSASNMSLIHAKDEESLLRNICNTMTEVGGYSLVWVGYAPDDGEGIRPIAWAGREEGYLGVLPSICGGEAACPAVMAISGPDAVILQDIRRMQDSPWRTETLKRGYMACIAIPLRFNSLPFGVLNILAGEPDAFAEDEVELLTELAGDLSYGIMSLRARSERDRAVEERQSYLEKLRKVMVDTVQAIASILEMRDPYISGHQRRVSQLSVAIAREMGLPPDRIEGIRFGSLIHDIGKIYVPAEFLSRPGRLQEIEFNLIRTHCQVGYDIIKDIEFPWPVAEMVLQHHEHMDGTGYPLGLRGEEIILDARILSVADAVEAMASHRPYRPARGIDTALEEISACRSSHYDCAVVDACIALFREGGFSFS